MSNMWGFDLDMTAVRLMRRNDEEWQEVAAEKIEGADIEERLMALVARVDDGAPVELFLPRDQILYTEVAVASEDTARDEIERALEGATPYAVDDLDIDWEMTGPGTACVAAIALETLDEAVAFAEVRGLKIGGFSTLTSGDDFPRQPDFTGHNILTFEDDEAENPAAPVQFASGRVTSKPRPEAGSLTPVAPDAEPVVKVEDDKPIMRISAPAAPPLDPGKPLAGPEGAPRVRTDIAAAVVSEQVASLSPPTVKVRRQNPAVWRVGAVFAIALLVTLGIATLVWQLLPLGPGTSEIPLTEDTGAGMEAPGTAPEVEVATPAPAAAPEPDTTTPSATPEVEVATPEAAPEAPVAADPEPAPELAEAAPVPDLPQPSPPFDVAEITAPKAGNPPEIAELAPVSRFPLPRFRTALRSGEGLPFVDLGLPAEPTPRALAAILVTAPKGGPSPVDAEGDLIENIYLASIDAGDVSFDAVALPDPARLRGTDLPQLGAAPQPFVADPLPEEAPAETAEVVARLDRTEPLLPEPETPPAETVVEAAPARDTGLPTLTAFAKALPESAPRARPADFAIAIERLRYGGRTRSELAELRPPARPASAQAEAIAAREAAPEATQLAVAQSPAPRGRPQDFDAIVAVAIVQKQAERVTASLDYQTPNTSAAIEAALEDDAEPEPEPDPTPRLSIPSSANVARQATIQDAIRLNRVNLVGVYGTSADRRALVRLPSGRFVKVKVGDRVDGGTVSRITDDALIYKKGRRTVSLSVPKG